MKQPVILTIQGKQFYENQEPEVIQLVTEGTMEKRSDGWELCYEESELTGLLGVTTTFRVEGDKIILMRSGRLRSRMEFRKGIIHESLYEMEFGALMIAVCAQQIDCCLSENGGTVTLVYAIDIEHTASGLVEYHLQVQTK